MFKSLQISRVWLSNSMQLDESIGMLKATYFDDGDAIFRPETAQSKVASSSQLTVSLAP